jgi:cytochrome c-type biogenesis protein CcmH
VLLWVILASLTAIVLFVLLRPLAGSGGSEPGRDAFNATVYRDQLDEIEADRARGLIGEAEAEAARLEVARRLLAADEMVRGKSDEAKGGALARTALIGVALALPLAALSLYLLYGSPRLPDQPLTARLTDPAQEKNVGALVARVEARLRAHPEEGEGWDAIAPVYMAGRRYADAADAYGHAIRLLGPSAERLSGYGQALVLEKGGLVSEEARRALEQALARDVTLVEPRILLAIAKEQDGDYEAAIEDWRGLMDREGTDERWRAMVQTRIADAEGHLSGKPPAADATPPVVSGPSAADVAAAQTMSPAERQTMVEGMVQRLAARLDAQGDDLAGWLRLVRAYTVLGRDDEAREALARAKSQFAGNTQAIEQLDALAAELGLKS